MFPRIVVMNHSAPFLCRIQRRMKIEPFDLYLYHQSEDSIIEIVQNVPAVIVLARRYGYPKSDEQFIRWFHGHHDLKDVPLVLSLLVGMTVPAERAGVTVVVSQPDFSDLDDIVTVVHRILADDSA